MQHPIHIGQNGIAILLTSRVVTLLPKITVALAHSRNEIVLLHVAGRKRTVKIIDQGHLRPLFLLRHPDIFIDFTSFAGLASSASVTCLANTPLPSAETLLGRLLCLL